MKNSHAEIRQRFIDYFKKNGHRHVVSSSLIPENDPTILFANAGMNQFKNLFLGLEHRDYKRAVTVQKCVRAGGKHNDLDNVGFTARHHTFFEMLGNFSFADYFKKDAIHFAWDFLTNDLKIPKEKLYITVHLSDDEAADIWHKQEGVPLNRIFRFDSDNFWKMGEVGPCGPCTEIFYDHGPHAGKESDPYKGIASGEDRFVEIWNLVFMQYNENPPGTLTPLPNPSVDTGSGLERVTAAMQGKLNNYDTDLFWPLISRAAEISKKTELLQFIERMNKEGIHAKVDPKSKELIAALRVVADHTRSCSFLIADGALPSNEGRGYVLRRILRRAVRFANLLSGGHAFLPEMSEVLISHMSQSYPELAQRKVHILSTLRDEQDRFMVTLGTGETLLSEELAKLKSKSKKEVPGELVFKLYDTYGFPADLTRILASEQGFSVDEKKFELEMEAARTKAKASWKGKGIAADEAHIVTLTQKIFEKHKATEFVGYQTTSEQGKVLALSDGSKEVDILRSGQAGLLITPQTPFYAEGGGQVGDTGAIQGKTSKAQVHNTSKNHDVFVHHVEVENGEIRIGDEVSLFVSQSPRRSIASNHSATHLLHSALKKVLGAHVQQAGSLVDAAKTRFDFTHNKALSTEEMTKVEALVNEEIGKANPVEAKLMGYKEAVSAGAIALFGEKYGDQVRVLRMGDFSTELCGGTHVQNTSQIRFFKIISEGGVSSGVRRIEAITGENAIRFAVQAIEHFDEALASTGLQKAPHYLKNIEATAHELSEESLKKSTLAGKIEQLKEQARLLEREVKKLQGGQVNVDDLLRSAKSFSSKSGQSKIVFADLALDDREVLAQITDQLKNKIQSGVVVVVGKGENTHPLIVSVSKDLNPEISAGGLLKEIATIMGGKGGGRPDFAQGAVPDRTKIQDAMKKANHMVGLQ